MITRLRWYRLKLPISLHDFFSRICSTTFNDEVGSGFSALESDNGQRFRFVWRSLITTTSLDEDGSPLYQTLSTVNFQDFCILGNEEKLLLRLEAPSRNSREVLNRLESIVGMGFACQPITLTEDHLQTLFKAVDVKQIISMKISGTLNQGDIISRMEFASKKGLNKENISVLDQIKYHTESATYELSYSGTKGQLTYTPTGLCKISGKLSPLIISMVEQALIIKKTLH